MKILFSLSFYLGFFHNLCFSQTTFEKSYLLQGSKQVGISIIEYNSNYIVSSLADDCGACISTECLTNINDTGGINYNHTFSKGTTDEVIGNVVVMGNDFLFSITYDHDNFITTTKEISIQKVDSLGSLIYETIIRDTLLDLRCKKLIVDDQNNIYALVNNSMSTIRIYKIDSSGLILWEKSIGSSPYFSEVTDALNYNNNIFMLGYGIDNGDLKTFFSKIDTSGNIVWNNEYSNPDTIRGISLNFKNNEFIICGQQFDSSGNAQIALLRTDTIGAPTFLNRISTIDRNYIYSSKIDSQNNLILTGVNINSTQEAKLLVIRSNINGNQIWNKTFCLSNQLGCYSSVGNSIIESTDHMIFVCGQVQNTQTYPQLYILKLDSSGILNSINEISLNKKDEPVIFWNQYSEQYSINNLSDFFDLTIFDVNGKIVFKEKNELHFTFPDLETGYYVYQINTSKSVFSGKIFH